MRPLPICCLLALAAALAAGDAAVLDLIIRKERGATACWVVAETIDEVRWKMGTDAALQENKTPRRDVRSIQYAFQRQSGAWQQGMEARERGKYAESAELFEQLAAGNREAEQVVGALEAGASWELDGKPQQAAGEEASGLPSNVEFGVGNERNVLYVTVDKALYRIRLNAQGFRPFD